MKSDEIKNCEEYLMTLKAEFLKIETYEEFDRRRDEFRGLKFDSEIVKHMGQIFPKAYAPKDMHVDLAFTKKENHK